MVDRFDFVRAKLRTAALMAFLAPFCAAAAVTPSPKAATPQPTSTTDGTIVTRFAYDELGNRVSQTDAEGRITRWEYDVMSRETARVLPDGKRETKEYDLVGNLTAHTDFNGDTTHYTYDVMDRVTTVDYPSSPDVSFTYTPMGIRATATDGNGTMEFGYNRRDWLTAVQFPHGEAVAYSYDLVGNRTELITPNQHLRFEYDARNRLTTVTADHGTTRFEYDQVGNRTAMVRPNGVRTEYDYDTRNRLVRMTHRAANGALIFDITYTLSSTGLRLGAIESDTNGVARSIVYQYDGAARLVSEIVVARDPFQSRTAVWTYDKVGNRQTQTLVIDGLSVTTEYSYDVNDRLLTEATGGQVTRYTYDDNGNTLSKDGPGGVIQYTYNEANKLVEMRDGADRFTYTYDVDGLRIGQTYHPANGTPVSTFYLLDKSVPYAQVIEEHVQEGNGPRRLAASFTFGDDLIAQTRGQVTHYLLADGMGSTRVLTDHSGSVTDTFTFDAFGNELVRTGATVVGHLYRGEEFDPNLGFYNLRARFYDPKVGRFTTIDTFAGFNMDPPSLHKYLYAHADPINGMDPSGHMTLKEVGTAISIAATLATIYTTVQTIGEFASGERELSAKEVGLAFVWAYAGSKLGPLGGKLMNSLRRAGCLSNSFSGDTLVETADGLKRIDEIAVGDLVMSRNMDTGKHELQRVSAVMSSTKQAELIVLTLEGGTQIEATPEHLILSDGEWTQAQHITTGMNLMTLDGRAVQVAAVERISRHLAVFDLTVENNRNFFVSQARVLVHNISPCEKAAQALAKLVPKSCLRDGACVDFAQNLEELMLKKGMKGKRLCVRSLGGKGAPYSDKFGSLGSASFHYAVQVGELVFDNKRPEGIPISEWVKDLGGSQFVGSTGSGAPLELVEQEMGSPFDCARR